MIRPVRLEDAEQIAEIYNYYILNTIVTFEEVVIDGQEMLTRIKAVIQHHPWLVYEKNGIILGYAYATLWNKRSAYKRSAECTIYLKHDAIGGGIGSKLYGALFECLVEMNFHVIIGGISLPNPASQAIHEKFGFQKVAHFKEVGKKFGKWIDVGYWELVLDN